MLTQPRSAERGEMSYLSVRRRCQTVAPTDPDFPLPPFPHGLTSLLSHVRSIPIGTHLGRRAQLPFPLTSDVCTSDVYLNNLPKASYVLFLKFELRPLFLNIALGIIEFMHDLNGRQGPGCDSKLRSNIHETKGPKFHLKTFLNPNLSFRMAPCLSTSSSSL